MSRIVFAIVVALVFAGTLALAWSTRGTEGQATPPAAASPAQPAAQTVAAPAAVAAESPAPTAQASTAEQVAGWVSDTQSEHPDRRATAIKALADAPAAAAVPALRQVLTSGEVSVDRPLALASLTRLAIAQGDADSSIRNAIREAIYHGDGGDIPALAQDALDTVERELAARPQ